MIMISVQIVMRQVPPQPDILQITQSNVYLLRLILVLIFSLYLYHCLYPWLYMYNVISKTNIRLLQYIIIMYSFFTLNWIYNILCFCIITWSKLFCMEQEKRGTIVTVPMMFALLPDVFGFTPIAHTLSSTITSN